LTATLVSADPSPEFRLFCLALRPVSDAADRANFRTLAAASPDWKAILRGAHRHRVASQLLSALKRTANIIPAPVIAALREQTRLGATQVLIQITELRRLLGLFADAGIRVLVLKGIVLSVQLYGNPSSRMPGDIDLLIDPDRADDADALLIAAGYARRLPALSPRQRVAYRHWFREATYEHPVAGELDVHHRLSHHPSFSPWSFDELWDEREHVELAGFPVATLPRRCLALYLCSHGAEHGWERLRWLLDLAVLLRKPNEMAVALAVAESAGLGTALSHALHLAHDWLGLVVDEQLLAGKSAARLDGPLSRLYTADGWHRVPARASAAGLWRYSVWLRLYQYRLRSGWRYRIACLRCELISMGDWHTFHLPDWLFWAYPLIRPFGWLVRCCGAALHRRARG
jgi:hypothetical protein